jgi:hypothetical protein
LRRAIDGRRDVVRIERVASAIGLDAAAPSRPETRDLVAYRREPFGAKPPRGLPCEHDDGRDARRDPRQRM